MDQTWYRPSTAATRAELFDCPICGHKYPGKYFVRLSEAHPDLYPDPKLRQARKKIIDLRACRVCRLRKWQREYSAKLREQEAARIRAAYARAIEKGIEITDPRLIPPEARPKPVRNVWGFEPVLHYARILYKTSRTKLREIEARTETVLADLDPETHNTLLSVPGGKEGVVPAIDCLRTQWKLHRLRVKAAEAIRDARRIDLQNVVAAADPTRIDPISYVPVELKAKLIRAAHAANNARVGFFINGDVRRNAPTARVGRPFTWLPRFLGKSQHVDQVRKAWSDHIARAKNSASKAATYLRSSWGKTRPRLFTMDATRITQDYDKLTFTARDFYEQISEGASLALKKIETAIDAGILPTHYTLDGPDEVRYWEELVPLHRQRIRDMRTGFDPLTRNNMDPFSRRFVPRVLHSMHSDAPNVQQAEKTRRRNRYQIAHGLDHNNMALPAPLARDEQEAAPVIQQQKRFKPHRFLTEAELKKARE